ncbi:MAG: tRNA-dihydrouridine synthase family protein, partial [Verrucomicrobia bacterium]|nr:tRNA-dihydrouridine synthase family protein [Verrucomicrobiota bacterium]
MTRTKTASKNGWILGGLALSTRVVLAPMAGYTDLPFRRLVRSFGGVGLAFSEMVNPDSILRGRSRKSAALVATAPDDRPLGWQIYGTHPDLLAEAAQWFEARGAELIDVNMGCPQKKICSRGGGAALMKKPDLAVALARRVVESVKIPVTVKLRLGWDAPDVAVELARGLEGAGAAALTVHGRTRAQRFAGEVDLDGIRQVVEAVRIPVIANGDVFTLAAAREMFRSTGCAAIMIG